MSDSFIREVDEDLRQKQINDLWKKYGKFIIGAAIAIVIIVAGRGIYNYIIESRYEEQADNFVKALSLNGAAQTALLDEISESGVEGYELLAAFKKAEIAIAADDKLAAVAIYDDFINNASVPQIYLNMANMQAAILELDTASVDKIRGRLALIMDDESTFKYLATELLALSELNNGDVDDAKARLEALVGDIEAPGSIKNRAEQYLSVIEE